MDVNIVLNQLNEVLAEEGESKVSSEDWDFMVNACVVNNATKVKREEQRQQISHYNESEVKNEVANATKVKEDFTGETPVIKTSSGVALPDILESKPSKDELKSGYCCSNSEKIVKFPDGEPISKDDVIFREVDESVQNTVKNTEAEVRSEYDKKQNMKSVTNRVNKAYKDSDVQKARREAMQNPNKCSKQAEDKTVYIPDFFVSNGEEVKFKTSAVQVDWNGYFCGDVAKDMDTLSSLVSRFVSKNYGGFKNIRRIVVRDERIIINNKNCIIPKLDDSCASNTPNDSADYIKNGAIASFFDWYYISKMTNLGVLDFDSEDLVLDKVMPDLGWGGVSGTDAYKGLFCSNDNLRKVIISGESVSRQELADMIKEEQKNGTVSSKSIVGKLNKKARWKKIYRDTVDTDNGGFWNKLFAGKAPNIIGTADAWREWQWSTVKNFANNRGNKGVLKFGFGTVGRVALALAVTPITLAPRLVKGVGTIIKDVFKSATTAISDEEIHGIDGLE